MPRGVIQLNEIATPATPPSGSIRMYGNTDGSLVTIDDAGNESVVSGTSFYGLGYWDYESQTSPSPGNQEFRFDDTVVANATEFYIDYTNNNNTDMKTFIDSIASGTIIFLQEKRNANNHISFSVVTNTPGATFATMTITIIEVAGTITDGREFVMVAFPLASGSGGGEPANQIVYGTGSGTDSDADFTYNAALGQLYVNTTNGSVGSVSSATPGTIAMFGVNGSNIDGGGFYFESGSVLSATVDQLIAGTFDYVGGTGGTRTTVDTNIINGSAVGGQFVVETGLGGSATITAATATRAAAAGYGGGLQLETGFGSDASITLAAPNSFGSTATGGNGGTITIRAGGGGSADVIDDATGVANGGSGGGIILEAGQFGIATADGTATDGTNGSIQFRVAGDSASITIDPSLGTMVFHSTTGSIFGISGADITGNLGVGGDLFIETGNSGTLAGGGGAMILLGGAAFEAGNGGVIELFCQQGAGYPNAWGIVAFVDTPAITPTSVPGITGLHDFDIRLDGVPAEPAFTTLTITVANTDTMQDIAVKLQTAIQTFTTAGEVVQAVDNVFKLYNDTADPDVGEAVFSAGTGGNPDLFGAIGTAFTATVVYLSNPVGLSGVGGEIGIAGGEGATKEGAQGGNVSISAGRGGQGYNVTSISVTAATDTIVLPGYLVPSFVSGRSFTIFAGPNVGNYTTDTVTFDGVNTSVVTNEDLTTDSSGTDELVVQDDTVGGDVIIEAGQGNGNGSAGTVRIVGAVAAVSVYGTPAPTYIAGGVTITGGSVGVGASEAQGGSVTIFGGSSASAVASNYVGGSVNIQGGFGINTGQGGSVGLSGGGGGDTGAGGSAALVGGTGGGTSGSGGNVSVFGGAVSDGNGGTITIRGGDGVGTDRDGGYIEIFAGDSTGTQNGADVTIQGGAAVGSNGGDVIIRGGTGENSTPGTVQIYGGAQVDTGDGGGILILGGAAVGGNNQGGGISIAPGVSTGANSGSTLDLNAGDGGTTGGGGYVTIKPGQGNGGSEHGNILMGRGTTTTTRAGDFLYVPTSAGTPTGTPPSNPGFAPIVIDTTNNKLYFYSNGAWRDAGP